MTSRQADDDIAASGSERLDPSKRTRTSDGTAPQVTLADLPKPDG